VVGRRGRNRLSREKRGGNDRQFPQAKPPCEGVTIACDAGPGTDRRALPGGPGSLRFAVNVERHAPLPGRNALRLAPFEFQIRGLGKILFPGSDVRRTAGARRRRAKRLPGRFFARAPRVSPPRFTGSHSLAWGATSRARAAGIRACECRNRDGFDMLGAP
jgi:hypothetical protein